MYRTEWDKNKVFAPLLLSICLFSVPFLRNQCSYNRKQILMQKNRKYRMLGVVTCTEQNGTKIKYLLRYSYLYVFSLPFPRNQCCHHRKQILTQKEQNIWNVRSSDLYRTEWDKTKVFAPLLLSICFFFCTIF